jgi:hypothetical protein
MSFKLGRMITMLRRGGGVKGDRKYNPVPLPTKPSL